MSALVLDKFAELITFALGLVAALAWNEAIQQLFTQLLGEAGGALAAKFVYAVIVTLIVIFATIAVSRAAERAKQREALFGNGEGIIRSQVGYPRRPMPCSLLLR